MLEQEMNVLDTNAAPTIEDILSNPQAFQELAERLGFSKVKEGEPSGLKARQDKPEQQPEAEETQEEGRGRLMSETRIKVGEDGPIAIERYVPSKTFTIRDVKHITIRTGKVEGAEGNNGELHFVPTVVCNCGVTITIYRKHAVVFHDNWEDMIRMSFNSDGHPLMFREKRENRGNREQYTANM